MREIDEAVRQDDTARFFQQYGLVLGVLIAFVLAALLAWWWWDSSRESALEAQSETLVSALDSIDSGDFDGAEEKVASLVANGTPGARSAAQFIEAAAAIEAGDTARAAEVYAAIAADTSVPDPLRDLALVRRVATDFDRMEPGEVIATLANLATPDSAFFGSAGELVAIAHLEAGNRDEAGALFAAIAQDEAQPQTLRSRARQMAGLLGVDAIEDVDALLEEQQAGAQGPVQAPVP